MAKTPRPWIVTKHDPIQKIDDHLWTVDGDVPGLPVRRRMTIIKRDDGGLMFFNAVPLADEVLDEVRSWGRPSQLVVPHHQHMIDAHAFRDKLGIDLFGPAECADEIKKRAPLAGTLDAIPGDDRVKVHASVGNKLGEPVLEVRGASGTTLVFGDLVQNTPKESLGFLMNLIGFGGGPKVVPVFKLMFMKDKSRAKAQLSEWSALPGLTRLVPTHGHAITTNAPAALQAVADAL